MTTANQDAAALEPKAKRPRLSHEQRLARLANETARVKKQQQDKVRDLMDDALATLLDARMKADAAGMETESRMIGKAIEALGTEGES